MNSTERIESQNDELDIHEILRVVLSHARGIMFVVGGFLLAGMLYAFFWPPTYRAVTTVKVPDNSLTPQGMLKELDPFTGSGDPIQTYVEIAKSETVAREVIATLNLPSKSEYSGLSDQELVEKLLKKKVTITNTLKSNILSIQADARTPQLAADLANAWAQAFIGVNLDISHKGAESKREFLEAQADEIKQRLQNPDLRLNDESKADELIYAQLLQALQQANLESKVNDAGIVVVDAALPPEKADSPKKLMSILLALILGLFVGVQSAFLAEKIRDRVIGDDALKRSSGLPNYALIPNFQDDYPENLEPPAAGERFSPKSLILNPVFNHAYYREAFKILRTNLTLAQAGEPPRVVAVLSPGPEEGKTLVNANLAISLAQTGKKVLLVDADLRKSSVRKIFGMPNGKETGLSLALTGQGNWRDMVSPSGTEGLDILPNTLTPPNPAELLGSEAMRNMILEWRKAYDFVVLDGAPVLPVTDSVVLSTFLDGVVLLVRWDQTRLSEFHKALEHLKSVKAKVLGTLLNYVNAKRGLYGYGYGGYGYGNYRYASKDANKDEKVVKK